MCEIKCLCIPICVCVNPCVSVYLCASCIYVYPCVYAFCIPTVCLLYPWCVFVCIPVCMPLPSAEFGAPVPSLIHSLQFLTTCAPLCLAPRIPVWLLLGILILCPGSSQRRTLLRGEEDLGEILQLREIIRDGTGAKGGICVQPPPSCYLSGLPGWSLSACSHY